MSKHFLFQLDINKSLSFTGTVVSKIDFKSKNKLDLCYMIGEELNIIDTTGLKCPDGKMLVQSMEGKRKLNLVLPQSHKQLSWVIKLYKKQLLEVFYKKRIPKNSSNFIRKHLWWSVFLIKLQAWVPATLLKRDSTTGFFQ